MTASSKRGTKGIPFASRPESSGENAGRHSTCQRSGPKPLTGLRVTGSVYALAAKHLGQKLDVP